MSCECKACVATVKVNLNIPSYPIPFVYPLSIKTEGQRETAESIPLGNGTPPGDIKRRQPAFMSAEATSHNQPVNMPPPVAIIGSGVISAPVHNQSATAAANISNGCIRLL